MTELITHAGGGYAFAPSSATYSLGVRALPKYTIVHTTLRQPVPYVAGFDIIAQLLASLGRPVTAVCGVELRIGMPFATTDDFNAFNRDYAAQLAARGLHLAGYGPMTRTNVAPLYGAPVEPSLYAFSYTVPRADVAQQAFVLAGAGEMAGDTAETIVRRGETTPVALREKAAFVMQQLANGLETLTVMWADTTAVKVYTAHPLHLLLDTVSNPLGSQAVHGMHFFPSRPPIAEIEFEMDAHGVDREEFA